jgi:hypothetical protein
MSIETANALASGGYEVQRVTIDTQPETSVRFDLRSDQGASAVVLHRVVALEVRQHWSNWPFALEFSDISERQLEGLAISVSDGQHGQFSCMCASVEVMTG